MIMMIDNKLKSRPKSKLPDVYGKIGIYGVTIDIYVTTLPNTI